MIRQRKGRAPDNGSPPRSSTYAHWRDMPARRTHSVVLQQGMPSRHPISGAGTGTPMVTMTGRECCHGTPQCTFKGSTTVNWTQLNGTPNTLQNTQTTKDGCAHALLMRGSGPYHMPSTHNIVHTPPLRPYVHDESKEVTGAGCEGQVTMQARIRSPTLTLA